MSIMQMKYTLCWISGQFPTEPYESGLLNELDAPLEFTNSMSNYMDK